MNIFASSFLLQWYELASLPLLARDQLTGDELMTKFKALPPLERLREVFEVKEDGRLLWKKKPSSRANHVYPGREAKTKDVWGYYSVMLDGKTYRVHRIIWFMIYEVDPGPYEIDHINGNPIDNRVSNLRLCSGFQNSLNKKRPANNTSGIKGVSYDKYRKNKKWRVLFCGKLYGRYRSKKEALQALIELATKSEHSEFYRLDWAETEAFPCQGNVANVEHDASAA